MWRIHALRILYALIVGVMGVFVWQQVLFESAGWPAIRVIAKSMLAALALLCILGVRYPLSILPLLLLETIWKTIALGFVIFPAWQAGRMTPDLELLYSDSIGIVVAYLVIPWRYVWARYITHPSEPWTKPIS